MNLHLRHRAPEPRLCPHTGWSVRRSACDGDTCWCGLCNGPVPTVTSAEDPRVRYIAPHAMASLSETRST